MEGKYCPSWQIGQSINSVLLLVAPTTTLEVHCNKALLIYHEIVLSDQSNSFL